MQLNFLQEDLAATLQKSKRTSAPKILAPASVATDLFGGLPLAMPPEKSPKKIAEKPVAETPKKADSAFKTISEASAILDVPQHVLRFWESRFSQIKPLKMGGGRRYYRPEDIDILSKIQNLLYKQGYTIKGAKQAFNMKDKKPEEKEIIVSDNKNIVLSDKQKKQVSALRNELLALRDTLRPYLAQEVFA